MTPRFLMSVPRASLKDGVEAPSAPRAALNGTDGVLDSEALRRLGELDPTGANRLVDRILQAFEASAQRLLPQMHEAHRTGDHAGVRHVAHTLKSSSASIGAIKLSELCAEIETMIRLDNLGDLAVRIDRMDREAAAVLQALQHVRSGRS